MTLGSQIAGSYIFLESDLTQCLVTDFNFIKEMPSIISYFDSVRTHLSSISHRRGNFGPPMANETSPEHAPDVNGVHFNGDNSESSYRLGNFAVDECPPVRIAVIGAGYSGILCGIRIPQRLQKFELVIYERQSEFGGTW